MTKVLAEIHKSQARLGQAMDDLLSGKISAKEGRDIAKAEGAKGKAIQQQVKTMASMKSRRRSK